MHITFVKKIKADGTECRKCIEVQSRLEKDGYIEKINAIVIADENDENSVGLQLAKNMLYNKRHFLLLKMKKMASPSIQYTLNLLKKFLVEKQPKMI